MTERRDPVCINCHIGAGPCRGWGAVGQKWLPCSRWPATVKRPDPPSRATLEPTIVPHPDLVAAAKNAQARRGAEPHTRSVQRPSTVD